MSRLLAAVLCLPLLCGLLSAQAGEDALFSTDGYRLDRYRSPTPATVDGARTIDTATLQRLLDGPEQPVLIDVFRRPWLHGQFASDEPHQNIPGSLWLANVGEGRPEARWLDYFAHYLKQASGGDRDRRAGVLLQVRLLAVVERQQARRRAGLYPAVLVP